MTAPLTLRARAAAPIKNVWQALTDAAELRVWLAEHAEVELPHRYEFWGRYTPEGDAPHQRLVHVGEHTLRFTWLLDGEETTTEIQLTEESADSTIVSLSQTHWSFEVAMSGASIRGVLQTYWSLAIANLVDHVEGRPLNPRTDFTSATFQEEMVIDASADAVYDSLTDSAKATEWFGFPIGIEPVVGGRWAMGGFENNPNPAKVLDLTPGRAMTVDWGPVGIVTWELEESAGKTKLSFVQSGFDTSNPPYGAWTGWLSGLAELRRYHELADWRPIWLHDPTDNMSADAPASV
ncbi:SRPBCC domain-containing protein [Plantactinospora solaniradicis]|uniref:SRPBCC domain-containing protein n=1 Tax=Plantactinospora solaniradicis TaxID=1723736 RepID=A0ABW1K2A6_9ACTN